MDVGLAALDWEPAPLVVASESYIGDIRVRHLVRELLQDSRSEVTLWGDIGLSVDGTRIDYQPTVAAAAFKQHAIAAASMQQTCGSTEILKRGIRAVKHDRNARQHAGYVE